jgi:hypothetical protein
MSEPGGSKLPTTPASLCQKPEVSFGTCRRPVYSTRPFGGLSPRRARLVAGMAKDRRVWEFYAGKATLEFRPHEARIVAF